MSKSLCSLEMKGNRNVFDVYFDNILMMQLSLPLALHFFIQLDAEYEIDHLPTTNIYFHFL